LARELLIAAGPGEWRAALLEAGEPVELYVERGDRAEAGSIYLGRVRQLVPALGAALVDIGADRPAFLPQSEIVPRGRRLHEGERAVVQIRREAQGGKAARATMKSPAVLASGAAAWIDLLDRAGRLEPPARLHPIATFAAALAGTLRSVPDSISVDDPGAIADARTAFSGAAVERLPETEWPIDLDAVFAEALSETLALPGGGRAHFEATRAGLMIDIDSGTPETGSPEQTALATNLAAAAVVVRQIRLRNLGGGIVVDFVGLDGRAARDRVRMALAEALAPDPAGPQILGWTRLGHLELVRPRRGRSLAETLLERRAGGAYVKTAVTIAHEALRALRREARAQPGRQWRLIVAPDVEAALSGAAAPAVQLAEQRFARKIAIEAEGGRERERFEIAAL
jgi:Ribonuclease G/E